MRENAPQCVGVSVCPQGPSPRVGERFRRNGEVCDWLQRWGLEIDNETEVPKPSQTVNATDPSPMWGGLMALLALLAQES